MAWRIRSVRGEGGNGGKCTYADTNRLVAGVCELSLVGLAREDASVLDWTGGKTVYTPPLSGRGACLSILRNNAVLKQPYPQFRPSLHV